jgi:hypothetical protein
MIAGKAAVGDGIDAPSGLPAQPVLDAPHGFDVHDPVSAERHFDEPQHVL